MDLTDYHAKYFAFAYEITRRCPPDSVEKLAAALADAQDQVDRQREDLIGNIEGKLQQKTGRQELLALRWKLA